MLAITVRPGDEVRISHGGEDLYLVFSKKNDKLKLGFLGSKSFDVKRIKREEICDEESEDIV